jgi:hypothetical protein
LLAIEVAVVGARGWRELVAAGIVMGVFAVEVVLTTVRRLRSRVPVTAGDRNHSYDFMSRAPGDRSRTTVLYWGLGALAAGLGLAVATLPLQVGVLIAVLALCGAVAAGLALSSRHA